MENKLIELNRLVTKYTVTFNPNWCLKPLYYSTNYNTNLQRSKSSADFGI